MVATAVAVGGAGTRGAAGVPHDELDVGVDRLDTELAVAGRRKLAETVVVGGGVHLAIVEAVRLGPAFGL